MKTPPYRRISVTLLVVLSGLIIARLISLDFSQKFTTDVSALVSVNTTDQDATLALDILKEKEAHLLYFVFQSTAEEATREEAIQLFLDSLKESGHFSEVAQGKGVADIQSFAQWQFANRYDLLFPQWLDSKLTRYNQTPHPIPFEAWIAKEVVSSIETNLEAPDSLLTVDLLPQDPFNLTNELLLHLEQFDSPTAKHVAWAASIHPPLSEEGQKPVFNAIETAYGVSKTADASLEMHYTGIHRYAAESRDKIHAEVVKLNLLSIVAVGLIALLLLKKFVHYWHLGAIFIFSSAGALALTSIVFATPHILSLVIGSVLIGIVVDYGIHIITHPNNAHKDGYTGILREVKLPLLSGAISTVAGFAILIFSDLPLLRQMGFYISTAIGLAVVFCWLWFPLWKVSPQEVKDAIPVTQSRRPRLLVAICGLCLLVTVAGSYRITWHDDLRQLDIEHPEIDKEQQLINAVFGDTGSGVAYVSTGSTPAAARDNLEKWEKHLEAMGKPAPLSLSKIMPTHSDWLAAKAFGQNDRFVEALRHELTEGDYELAAFESFFVAWEKWRTSQIDYDTLFKALDNRLSGPSGHLSHWDGQTAWLMSSTPVAPEMLSIPEGTYPLDSIKSLNNAFSLYRKSLLTYALLGLGLTAAGLIAVWGATRGVVATLIPLGAVGFALGLFGWMNATLNLFHLIGVMLGYCLSMDYVLFALHAHKKGAPVPRSVGISALTTITAFGVLCLSSIVAVQSLGYTVVLIVTGSMLALFLFARPPHRE